MSRYQPRPPSILDWPRTVVYYLYAALATLALGLWGLPQVLVRPERAHRVASLWLGQMLGAARLILGVRVEYRGTPPAGDCIVASKHQSFLDILALAHACPAPRLRDEARGAARADHGLVRAQGGLHPHRPRPRQGGDEADHRRGRDRPRPSPGAGPVDHLSRRNPHPAGQKLPYKHGASTIQRATGLPIHPVAVNCGLFWPRRGFPIRGGTAVVEFLAPLHAGPRSAAATELLEERIEPASDRLLAEAGGLTVR